ncbi:MAG: MBL fold metallo-hydrolase [Bacteroidota bacterium]
MKIKTFTFNPFQENTFIVYDDSKAAAIIDAGCFNAEEEKLIDEFIQSENLKPEYLINTHCHIDHVAGLSALKSKYNVPFLAHKDDSFLLDTAVEQGKVFGFGIEPPPSINSFIDEPQEIKIGNSRLQVYHVPGHSPGSVALYAPEGEFVIVGDVLFSGSIGRTDLPGGDYKTLISSITEKLMVLPGNTTVYPGHGPATTIKHEHDTNPFLT